MRNSWPAALAAAQIRPFERITVLLLPLPPPPPVGHARSAERRRMWRRAGGDEGEGTPGGHISFHLFQKVFLITFLLPLLLRCFNLELHGTGHALYPNKAWQGFSTPPTAVGRGSAWPHLSPACRFDSVFVSWGQAMNDRLIALGPAMGLPQAICAKLLYLIAICGNSKGEAVKVDLQGHCEKPQTLRRGVHVSSSLSQSIQPPPPPLASLSPMCLLLNNASHSSLNTFHSHQG